MTDVRKVCKYGTSCYQRSQGHLDEFAHPADGDYLWCCRAESHKPEFISIRKLFEWCAGPDHNKAGKDSLRQVWDRIQELGENVPDFHDDLWNKLDDDGNGFINFGEFAEFTTRQKVRLPLGLDDLFCSTASAADKLRCGVATCGCTNFVPARCRCRYAETCYQKSPEHLEKYAHPWDPDWTTAKTRSDSDMCSCGHKRKLHSSAAVGAATVPYPSYWIQCETTDSAEFNQLHPMPSGELGKFQRLVDCTYSDVTTRDRAAHNGGNWMVPRNFKLISVHRNEHSKLWRKYCIRKAELIREKETGVDYQLFTDIKSNVWESFDADSLASEVNEWYLFHGTSAAAAINICQTDFKMRLAGSNTGTLYGKGTYLAESITKADEYAKAEDGVYTVLLCRVLGGQVRYCDDRSPDPDKLTEDVVAGEFDCILGDRQKVSGTYREIVVFDTENVYPEYVLKYRRGDLFKSKSFPGGG